MEKLLHLLNRDESDAFHCNIFRTARKISKQLLDNEEDIVSEHQAQAAAAENPNYNFCNFHGYLLEGDLETVMEVNCKKFKTHHCIFNRGLKNPVLALIAKQNVQCNQHYT